MVLNLDRGMFSSHDINILNLTKKSDLAERFKNLERKQIMQPCRRQVLNVGRSKVFRHNSSIFNLNVNERADGPLAPARGGARFNLWVSDCTIFVDVHWVRQHAKYLWFCEKKI